MTIKIFGNRSANNVLIQPVDAGFLSSLEQEIKLIQKFTSVDFCLIAIVVDKWNRDLSPWNAPAAFGNEPFGDGAKETLDYIKGICEDRSRSYYLGGYSLAALFSLWAAYETDLFCGIAAASPSVWFPNFTDHIRKRKPQTDAVYLSLGDKEGKAKNPLLASVSVRIIDTYEIIKEQKINCTLEWNPGNHFKDPELRCAKAFAWLLS